MIIAKRTDGTLLNIIAAAGSTVENQLLWLFDVPVQTGKDFVLQQFDENHDKELNVIITFILEELGVVIEEVESEKLDSLVERFKGVFPKSSEFSVYARATCEPVNAVEEPDRSLLVWMNHEEKLFRRLERQIVEKRMQEGFEGQGNVDVDGFISFSLSVQNRRKSRAGLALENHLEQIIDLHGISYSRVAVTENKSKPDFLFPDAAAYHNKKFPNELLTMLGVKTTCKDRWRQVLSEAAKISTKNLFTIEPGISENQTNEMKAHNLQLVLPKSIHESYSITQRSWLLDLSEFLAMTKERQNKAPISYSS